MDTLTIEIESVSKNATTAIDNLIQELDKLDAKLQEVVNNSKNFAKLKDNINGATVSTQKKTTSKQPYSNYGSKESQFKSLKIDESSLKKAFSEVTNSTALATTTTQKFRDEMGRVVTVTKQTKDGVDGYRVSIRDANTETKKSTSIFKSLTSGISGMALQFQLIWHTVSSIASGFGAMALNAGDYYEAFNLFATTLGSQAEQGLEWVEMFSDALYLDPVNVMQYMGSFDSLIKGLGVGEDKAYLMSQQLTQLTYDLASFKNLDFETAFLKLQSGVVGEIEPLRAVGVALSEATLQELAYTLGIEESVSAMSEAEKAQLRYIQIMRSSTDWQADMGKTLTSPTNALRVLKQQFMELGRAIGNVFLPILMTIVPYIMVVTEWLNTLAQTLANILSDLFGIDLDFSLDTGDFDTGVGTVVGGLEDIGSSADSAKNKLNTMLAPFDELNNVQTQVQSAGGGAGVGGGTGGDLGVDLPTYDALSKLTDQFRKNIDKARKNLKKLLPIVEGIALGIGAWNLIKFIGDIQESISNMTNLQKKLLGITGIVLGFKITGIGVDMIEEGDIWKGIVAALGGTGLVAAGAWMLTGNITATLLITIASIGLNVTDSLQNLIALNPTMEEIIGWVNQIPVTSNIGKWLGETAFNIVNTITGAWSEVSTWFDENVTQPIVEFFTIMWDSISTGATNAWNGIVGVWTIVSSWFDENVTQPVANFFTTMWDLISTSASNTWNGVVSVWTIVSSWFDTNIIQPVSNFFGIMWNNLVSGASNAWSGIKSVFSTVATFFKNTFETAWTKVKNVFSTGGKIFDGIKEGIVEAFKTIVNAIITGINKVVAIPFNTINGILNFIRNINILGVEPFKGLWSQDPLAIPQIPLLYTGGFVDSADLFFANENGIPEMIGRIGNQTAVANNDQITTSITNALISALDNYDFGGQSPTIIYLGNKKLYEGYGEHQERENDRYGVNMIRI